MFDLRLLSSYLLSLGRRVLTVALWTLLAMILMTLVLVACNGSAASTVVNSL